MRPSFPKNLDTNCTCEHAGKKGFTLLELLLVLVIFSLAVALVSPYVAGGLSSTRLKTTAKKMTAALNYARNRSLRERQNYYVDAQRDSIVISAKGGAPRKEIAIPEGLSMKTEYNRVIVFYPGGGSNGGVFELGESSKKPVYAIRVEPATGAVTVSRF